MGRTWAALCLALCAAGGVPGGAAQQEQALSLADLTSWSLGPVRWLLLPEERKAIRQLRDEALAAEFIEGFWALRDPDPSRPGNPYREEFDERVAAADLLYAEENHPGSQTDRGRALILLGPPTHVSVSSEPALVWDIEQTVGQQVTTRRVNVETWGYRLEDLPAGVVGMWVEKKKSAETTLALRLLFRSNGRRTLLVEGEQLLEIARQAAARQRKE